jgi:hypothetical protein
MPARELRALGFEPGGPEIDFGMRWGEQQCVRVSFAPYAERDDGYLYAYDRASDRYLVLAEHTTAQAVDAAWRELNACTTAPDAYLALVALDEQPLPIDQAQALLLHCVDREFSAYRDFIQTSNDAPVRVDAAHAVVVQRAARAAAEQILRESVSATRPESAPVIVRYRITEESNWTGRVAALDLDSAAEILRRIDQLGRERDLSIQATSASQGNATVAADRVPELGFARTHGPVIAEAPRLAL